MCIHSPAPWCCLATEPGLSHKKGSLRLGPLGHLLPLCSLGTLGSPDLLALVFLLESRLAAWEWGDGQSGGLQKFGEGWT